MSNKTAWIGDNASQQIQEQSAKYGGGAEMSGYAALTRSTTMSVIWVNANLGDVCTKLTDGSHNPPESITSGFPMLSARNVQSGKIDFSYDYRLISPDLFEEEDKRTRIGVNDLLLTIVGALGRVALVTDGLPKFTLQRSVAVLTAPKLHPEYFRYALQEPDFQKQILDNAKGTAQKGIYLKKLSTLEIKLPSFAEQQQIAAQLDELLAQVDSIKTRLDAIPKILKRFRQSILSAAVSGKLTEDWRKVNSVTQSDFNSYPTGDNLPISWRIVPLGKYVENWDNDRVPVSSKEREKLKGDYPYYGASGQIDTINGYTHDGVFVLIGEDGANLLARTKPIAFSTHGKIWVNNHAHVLRCKDGYENKYFECVINALDLTPWVSGSAQPKLNQKNMNQIPISIPPKEEQTEIVNRVDQLFAYADQIEQRVKDAQARVNHLTQAILAKAFRGELTADWRAQNPELISGENSAEALLKRIKAERESGKSGKKSKASL